MRTVLALAILFAATLVGAVSAQADVITDWSSAQPRGYSVIVPEDCLSSIDAYHEQYAIWHLYKGGPAIVTDKTTVTRSDLITF